MFFIYIGLILIIFLISLLLSKATVLLSVRAVNKHVTIKVTFYVYIKKLSVTKTFYLHSPAIDEELIKNSESGIKWLEEKELDDMNSLSYIFQIYEFVKKHASLIELYDLRWQTHFGMLDAATTGKITGGLWMSKYWIIGFLYRFITPKTAPVVRVTPHFQQKVFQSRLECMFTFSIGKAIKVSLEALKMMRRLMKKQKHKVHHVSKYV